MILEFGLLATVLLLLWAALNSNYARLRSFNARWPPIDDEEFMSRLKPGTSRTTALRTRQIIAEQLGVPYEQIYPEQHFVDDLWCD